MGVERMDFGPQQIGKWLIAVGLFVAAIGAMVVVLGRVGLFRLPGDLEFGGKGWRVYIPLASSLILSALLTAVLWLIHLFRR